MPIRPPVRLRFLDRPSSRPVRRTAKWRVRFIVVPALAGSFRRLPPRGGRARRQPSRWEVGPATAAPSTAARRRADSWQRGELTATPAARLPSACRAAWINHPSAGWGSGVGPIPHPAPVSSLQKSRPQPERAVIGVVAASSRSSKSHGPVRHCLSDTRSLSPSLICPPAGPSAAGGRSIEAACRDHVRTCRACRSPYC